MLAFLAVAVLVIVVPGQDTALTISNTVARGRAAGIATAAGVATAQLSWTAAAAVGLAALLAAWEPGFTALRLLGAAYLLFLGAQLLRSAVTRRLHEVARRGRDGGPARAYRQGALSNLANPKMGVFFTSLLPQFAASFAGLLALGAVFAGLTLVWLVAYALVVARLGGLLAWPPVRRTIDAVTGAVLVAFGVRLAGERR